MVVRSLVTTMFLIVSANCSPPRSMVSSDEHRILKITFERSGEFGVPCGYKVELRRDGVATFVGEPAAKRKGEYRGSVRPEQFEKLAELITGRASFLCRTGSIRAGRILTRSG